MAKGISECVGIAMDGGDRPYQEDRVEFAELRKDVVVLALADGMGGHVGGAEASDRAVTAFLDFIRQHPQTPKRDWVSLLEAGLLRANRAIQDRVNEDDSLAGMGCTFVGVISDNESYAYVSVGDSPMYISRWETHPDPARGREHTLKRVNDDHSMRSVIPRIARDQGVSEDELMRSVNPNALRSALTGQDIDVEQMRQNHELDSGAHYFTHGDRIFIASDGVETLEEHDIAASLQGRIEAPQEVAMGIVRQVKDRHKRGQDNIAVLIFEPQTKVEKPVSVLKSNTAAAKHADARTVVVSAEARTALLPSSQEERTMIMAHGPSAMASGGGTMERTRPVSAATRPGRRHRRDAPMAMADALLFVMVGAVLTFFLAAFAFMALPEAFENIRAALAKE